MIINVAAVVIVLGLVFGGTLCNNFSEEAYCESLRAQGVKAYVGQGCLEKKCIVLQRDLNIEGAKE